MLEKISLRARWEAVAVASGIMAWIFNRHFVQSLDLGQNTCA
jgi:hypothetical protein